MKGTIKRPPGHTGRCIFVQPKRRVSALTTPDYPVEKEPEPEPEPEPERPQLSPSELTRAIQARKALASQKGYIQVKRNRAKTGV